MALVPVEIVKSFSNNKRNFGITLSNSPNGNVYWISQFSGNITLEDDLILDITTTNIILSQIESDGEIVSVIPILRYVSQNDESQVVSLSIDKGENFYIATSFINQVILPNNVSFTNRSVSSGTVPLKTTLIMKIDERGCFKYFVQIFGTDGDKFRISTDLEGNTYFISTMLEETTIIPNIKKNTITINNPNSFILMKIDTFGNISWILNGNGKSQGSDITILRNGNIAIIGSFNNILTFGGSNISLSTSQILATTFIANISSEGLVKRAILIPILVPSPNLFTFGEGISSDLSGNLLITGEILGSFSFGNFPVAASLTENLYVAKLTSDLREFLWVRLIRADGDRLNRIFPSITSSIDGSGVSYGTFFTSTDAILGSDNNELIIHLNSNENLVTYRIDSDGRFTWAIFFPNTIESSSKPLALEENVFITGSRNISDSQSNAFLAILSR